VATGTEPYDVLIAGYGPSGMLAAILLGRAGHRVAVIERYKTLYNLPRVGIVHDDVLRMFQEIGVIDAILPATHFLPVYELANKGKLLLANDVAPLATHGWPEMTSIYQPAFEATLDRTAKALPSVDVFQGYDITGVAQTDAMVHVTAEDAQFEGRYLIACDGGTSFVRQTLGIGLEDLGFDQDWLVIDAAIKKPRPDLPLLRQFCEIDQPGMTMQMGPDHRRWSFMIFPGEDPRQAIKHENVWKRLDRAEGGTPDEFEIIRAVSYQFRSLMAERWRQGRIFLAGDAAHQMPPFLAQGMCSGFRDSYNLAWKLSLVLAGSASEGILESYEAEREPNARATVIESLRVGQNVIVRDEAKAAARDAQLMAMQAAKDNAPGDTALIAFRVPGLDAGLIAEGSAGAGDVFGQGRVQRGAAQGLFDDIAGHGFMILGRDGDALPGLTEDEQSFWAGLGGGSAHFGGPDGLTDLGGGVTQLMDALGANIVIKRPDHYIYGAGSGGAGLSALLSQLKNQIGGQ